MHHPTDRIAHTTAFVTPVVEHWLEREIAQWVHPMKDRSDDPWHHLASLHSGMSEHVPWFNDKVGARYSSVVRVFAYGAMGHRIDPSWGGPIVLFPVPASAPQLV